jgi:hypothetical protein
MVARSTPFCRSLEANVCLQSCQRNGGICAARTASGNQWALPLRVPPTALRTTRPVRSERERKIDSVRIASGFIGRVTRSPFFVRGICSVSAAMSTFPRAARHTLSCVVDLYVKPDRTRLHALPIQVSSGSLHAAFFHQQSETELGLCLFCGVNSLGAKAPQLGPGAQVSQPIFTGGALTGNLQAAKSQHEQALISYRQTTQQAFGDVSDALIGYQKLHQVRIRQEDTVAGLQESVRLSSCATRAAPPRISKSGRSALPVFRRTRTRAGARHRIPKSRATLPLTRRRLATTVVVWRQVVFIFISSVLPL